MDPFDSTSQGTRKRMLFGLSSTNGTLRSSIHMVTLPRYGSNGGVPVITESDNPDPRKVAASPGIRPLGYGSMYGVFPINSVWEPSDGSIRSRRPWPGTAYTVSASPEIAVAAIPNGLSVSFRLIPEPVSTKCIWPSWMNITRLASSLIRTSEKRKFCSRGPATRFEWPDRRSSK